MIDIAHDIIRLERRVPLTISRGTQSTTEVLWLRARSGGFEGWGEAVAFEAGGTPQPIEAIAAGVAVAGKVLQKADPLKRQNAESSLRRAGVPSAVIAAVDQALWDWLGRSTGLPIHRILGLDPRVMPLVSATVGIAEPEAARRRVAQWLAVGDIRSFKLKLGSPAGIAADQAMFLGVAEVLPKGAAISVDANGGWSADDAAAMGAWLFERGVDHMEQPLPRGREAELRALRRRSPLAIFVDESIHVSSELPGLLEAGGIDGVNIKLMKSGGVGEALRLIHTAKSHGLRVMIGCYGSTALGNTAAATLGPLADYLDLDSHLNMKNDPFRGVSLAEGRLQLPPRPGFGVAHESIG